MSAIITADTHWNDNPRDESRWGLFDWLAEQQADELIILGDLTVAKNNHPARMVNRLVDGFIKLSRHYQRIYVLKGNHDYVDPNCPFFGFLTSLPNILFVTNVMSLETTIGSWLFMPAGTDWLEHKELLHNRNIFSHVSFDGAVSESGYQLTGVNPRIVIDAKAHVISGDVHKPQILAGGTIRYVGAPYHCRFGDDYTPRILLMQDKHLTDLYYPSPRKFSQVIHSLAELYRIKILPGDQIKIIAELRRADLPDWKNWREAIKEQAEQEGWVLFGPELKLQPDTTTNKKTSDNPHQSPEELVDNYAVAQKASEKHQTIGRELIQAARLIWTLRLTAFYNNVINHEHWKKHVTMLGLVSARNGNTYRHCIVESMASLG